MLPFQDLLCSTPETLAQCYNRGIYLLTQSDSRLFNLVHLKTRAKVHEILTADCCLQMMHTSSKYSGPCWTILQPTKILGWPSACRRPTIWDRIQMPHQLLQLITMNSELFSSSLALDVLLFLVTEINQGIRKAATMLTTQVWNYPKLTMKMAPVLSAHCCMQINNGPHMPVKREDKPFYL